MFLLSRSQNYIHQTYLLREETMADKNQSDNDIRKLLEKLGEEWRKEDFQPLTPEEKQKATMIIDDIISKMVPIEVAYAQALGVDVEKILDLGAISWHKASVSRPESSKFKTIMVEVLSRPRRSLVWKPVNLPEGKYQLHFQILNATHTALIKDTMVFTDKDQPRFDRFPLNHRGFTMVIFAITRFGE